MFWDAKEVVNVNNTGPLMDPCGTPTVKGKGSDKVF